MSDDFKFVGKDNWGLFVGSQIVLYGTNGSKVKGANGHGVILALVAPTERYPSGTCYYRVLGKLLEGATPCERVKLVKKTDRFHRDKMNVHGVAPSKRGRLAKSQAIGTKVKDD